MKTTLTSVSFFIEGIPKLDAVLHPSPSLRVPSVSASVATNGLHFVTEWELGGSGLRKAPGLAYNRTAHILIQITEYYLL